MFRVLWDDQLRSGWSNLIKSEKITPSRIRSFHDIWKMVTYHLYWYDFKELYDVILKMYWPITLKSISSELNLFKLKTYIQYFLIPLCGLKCMVVVLKVQYNSLIFFPKDFMLLYYQSYVSLLQKDFKILYLFQQQSFSSPTMLKELFWKESPMRYYQGQMQPRASFLQLLAC